MTIETEEKTVRRGSQERISALMWCPACRDKVEMVLPEQAARIAGVSLRTIYRWIEAGTIHFVEDSGRLLVCVPAVSGSSAGSDLTKYRTV